MLFKMNRVGLADSTVGKKGYEDGGRAVECYIKLDAVCRRSAGVDLCSVFIRVLDPLEITQQDIIDP